MWFASENIFILMRYNVRAVLVVGLLTGSLCVALAQSNGSVSEGDKAYNKVLLHATSAYEDLVEPALANDAVKMSKFITIGDQEAAATAKVLPAAAAKK